MTQIKPPRQPRQNQVVQNAWSCLPHTVTQHASMPERHVERVRGRWVISSGASQLCPGSFISPGKGHSSPGEIENEFENSATSYYVQIIKYSMD